MSKRGKDLFHLLEERERGGRPTPAPASSARTRRTPVATGSVMGNVRRWVEGFTSRPATTARRDAASPVAPAGLVLAAVALLCLGLGFALGRFLPKAASSPELNRTEAGAARRPGPIEVPPARPVVGETAATDKKLPAEKEAEELSTSWFELLRFPAPKRDEAARAAEYLRGHGVESARIRLFHTRDTKLEVWAVIAYAPRDEASAVLAKVKAVPATSSWPELKSKGNKLQLDNLLPKI